MCLCEREGDRDKKIELRTFKYGRKIHILLEVVIDKLTADY